MWVSDDNQLWMNFDSVLVFNYQFIQVCVLVYMCVHIWSFGIQDTGKGTFALIQYLIIFLEIFLFNFIFIHKH